MARTVDQQIAEAEAKLARLKTRAKASDTRRKIIIGSVVISNALKEPDKAVPSLPCSAGPSLATLT